MSLMLIACDRFFGIVYAMKAHVIERKACHSIIVIWVFSIAAGTPMLVKKKLMSRQWLDYTEMWCDDAWELKTFGGGTEKFRPGRMAYYTIISFILYFIPLVVMAVAYICVIRTLWTSKAPGERTTKDVNIQTKVKRKVHVQIPSLQNNAEKIYFTLLFILDLVIFLCCIQTNFPQQVKVKFPLSVRRRPINIGAQKL